MKTAGALARPVGRPRPARRGLSVRGTDLSFIVWIPFVAVIMALSMLADNLLLLLVGTAWAFGMAFMGARAPSMVFAGYWQGLFALAGAAYMGAFGRYPGSAAYAENVHWAAIASLCGIFVIVFTFQLICRSERGRRVKASEAELPARGAKWMFFTLLVVFAAEWFGLNLLLSSTGGLRQLVVYLLAARFILFALFFLMVLRTRSRTNLIYMVFISLYIAVPLSLTGSSGWSGVIILLLMVYLYHLVFGDPRRRVKLKLGAVFGGVVAAAALAAAGLLWEGGLKASWRNTLAQSGSQLTMSEKIYAFNTDAGFVMNNFSFASTLEKLTARLSSGVGYFSLVIRNVPEQIPYERGERAMAAAQNLLPRILFPNKKDLGGDSWLVQEYANIRVAGNDQNTSIGLGYIPEMYIDAGPFGIFAGSIVVGFFFAGAWYAFRIAAGNADLASMAFLVAVWKTYLGLETSLAKLTPPLVVETVMFTLILLVLKKVLYPRKRPPRPAAAV